MGAAPQVTLNAGDRVRTPDGWPGRVEAVLITGKVVVAHPDTGLAWWFPVEDVEPGPGCDEWWAQTVRRMRAHP